MAKAIRHFVGLETYGSPVERAQRADGQWFSRVTHRTPYGPKLGRWYPDSPEWEKELSNVYDGTVTPCAPETVMSWGFSRMEEVTAPNMRLRLPDVL